jgi:hypothetical protein
MPTEDGATVPEKPDVTSIRGEIDYMLKGKREWEALFKRRLRFSEERIRRGQAGLDLHNLDLRNKGLRALLALQPEASEDPIGLHCGSMLGIVRHWLGLTGLCYMIADDPGLLDEMIETVGELSYRGVEAILKTGAHFDFALFWEDIAFKNGPLVNPRMFREKVGPQYRPTSHPGRIFFIYPAVRVRLPAAAAITWKTVLVCWKKRDLRLPNRTNLAGRCSPA